MDALKKMKVISIMWGMILLGLFIVITTFGVIFKHKAQPYHDLEKEFANKTKEYVMDNEMYLEDHGTLKFKFEDLQNNDYMDELKVDDDECEGYVLVSNFMNKYKYKAYIKCDNYTSGQYKLNNK